MDYLKITLQAIVALSLLNVWLIQSAKTTRWRGGNAKTLAEEFVTYGLPKWMFFLVGMLKVGLSIALVLAIWFPLLLQPSSIGLAILLLGSIIMHLKIKDPIIKSYPALLFLVLCVVIAFS